MDDLFHVMLSEDQILDVGHTYSYPEAPSKCTFELLTPSLIKSAFVFLSNFCLHLFSNKMSYLGHHLVLFLTSPVSVWKD